MNDLTKYEGHTPLPWQWMGGMAFLHATSGNVLYPTHVGLDDIELEASPADAVLILDAPKLLAELKMLREKLVQISICASNAQYGQLDMDKAIYSIVEATKPEGR